MAQDRNLGAALQTGARQLQAPSVAQQDTTGQQQQMAYSDKLVSQLSAFGGVVSQKQMENTASAMKAEAAIAINQGKSLNELHESDKASSLQVFGETATQVGASTQLALVSMDQMKRDMIREIDEGDAAQMSPGEWREASLARYNEALNALPEGVAGRDLMAEMGQKVMSEVGAHHAQQNYAWRQKENLEAYTASVFSSTTAMKEAQEAGNDVLYKQAKADFENRMVKPDGMKEEAWAGVMTNAAAEALRFGNRDVYDAVIKAGHLSPEQRTALESGLESFKQREAEKGSLEQSADLAQIQQAAANGVGSEAIAQMIAGYNDKYQRTPITTNAAAGLFNQSSSVSRANAVAAQARADMRTATLTGQDYLLDTKNGGKNLDTLLVEYEGDSAKQMQIWATSHHQSPMLSQQMNAVLSPDNMLMPDGSLNPTTVSGLEKFKQFSQVDSTKALGMLKPDQAKIIEYVLDQERAGVPLQDAMVQAANGYANRANVIPPSKKEVTKMFKGEDFDKSGWFTEPEGLDNARSLAGREYDKAIRMGIPPAAAQAQASAYVKRNLQEVNGKLVNTNGVNIKETFYAADANQLVTTFEDHLRNNPATAAQVFGSTLGDDAVISEVVFTNPANGSGQQMLLYFGSKEHPEARNRMVPVTPAIAQKVMLEAAAQRKAQEEAEAKNPSLWQGMTGAYTKQPD